MSYLLGNRNRRRNRGMPSMRKQVGFGSSSTLVTPPPPPSGVLNNNSNKKFQHHSPTVDTHPHHGANMIAAGGGQILLQKHQHAPQHQRQQPQQRQQARPTRFRPVKEQQQQQQRPPQQFRHEQQVLQKQQPSMSVQEQKTAVQGVISMEEVMEDLRILEQQQRDSQRKLASAQLTKENRLTQRSTLENQLANLKYSNGQQRAELAQFRQTLSKSTRQLETAKLSASRSSDSIRNLDDDLKRALAIHRAIQGDRRHLGAKISVHQSKLAALARGETNLGSQVTALEQSLSDRVARKETLRQSISDSQRKTKDLSQETTKLRSRNAALEEELRVAQEMQASTKLRAEELANLIKTEEAHHDEQVKSLDARRLAHQTNKMALEKKRREEHEKAKLKLNDLFKLWEISTSLQSEEGLAASNRPTLDNPTIILDLKHFHNKVESVQRNLDETEHKTLVGSNKIAQNRSEVKANHEECSNLLSEVARINKAMQEVNSIEKIKAQEIQEVLSTVEQEQTAVEALSCSLSFFRSQWEKKKAPLECTVKEEEAIISRCKSESDAATVRCEQLDLEVREIKKKWDEEKRSQQALLEKEKQAVLEAEAKCNDAKARVSKLQNFVDPEVEQKKQEIEHAHEILAEETKRQIQCILKEYPALGDLKTELTSTTENGSDGLASIRAQCKQRIEDANIKRGRIMAEVEQAERDRREKEKRRKELEERLEKERLEKERQRKELEEKYEKERRRKEVEERLEKERMRKELEERLEKEKQEKEKRREELEERLEKERLEKERLRKELEKERLEKERRRKELEERQEKEKLEKERRRKVLEMEKLEEEKRRKELEERQEKEKSERERRRKERERREKERKRKELEERQEKERQRKEMEVRREKERLEKERVRKEMEEKQERERQRKEIEETREKERKRIELEEERLQNEKRRRESEKKKEERETKRARESKERSERLKADLEKKKREMNLESEEEENPPSQGSEKQESQQKVSTPRASDDRGGGRQRSEKTKSKTLDKLNLERSITRSKPSKTDPAGTSGDDTEDEFADHLSQDSDTSSDGPNAHAGEELATRRRQNTSRVRWMDEPEKKGDEAPIRSRALALAVNGRRRVTYGSTVEAKKERKKSRSSLSPVFPRSKAKQPQRVEITPKKSSAPREPESGNTFSSTMALKPARRGTREPSNRTRTRHRDIPTGQGEILIASSDRSSKASKESKGRNSSLVQESTNPKGTLATKRGTKRKDADGLLSKDNMEKDKSLPQKKSKRSVTAHSPQKEDSKKKSQEQNRINRAKSKEKERESSGIRSRSRQLVGGKSKSDKTVSSQKRTSTSTPSSRSLARTEGGEGTKKKLHSKESLGQASGISSMEVSSKKRNRSTKTSSRRRRSKVGDGASVVSSSNRTSKSGGVLEDIGTDFDFSFG